MISDPMPDPLDIAAARYPRSHRAGREARLTGLPCEPPPDLCREAQTAWRGGWWSAERENRHQKMAGTLAMKRRQNGPATAARTKTRT